jgi:hypothetical protein
MVKIITKAIMHIKSVGRQVPDNGNGDNAVIPWPRLIEVFMVARKYLGIRETPLHLVSSAYGGPMYVFWKFAHSSKITSQFRNTTDVTLMILSNSIHTVGFFF